MAHSTVYTFTPTGTTVRRLPPLAPMRSSEMKPVHHLCNAECVRAAYAPFMPYVERMLQNPNQFKVELTRWAEMGKFGGPINCRNLMYHVIMNNKNALFEELLPLMQPEQRVECERLVIMHNKVGLLKILFDDRNQGKTRLDLRHAAFNAAVVALRYGATDTLEFAWEYTHPGDLNEHRDGSKLIEAMCSRASTPEESYEIFCALPDKVRKFLGRAIESMCVSLQAYAPVSKKIIRAGGVYVPQLFAVIAERELGIHIPRVVDAVDNREPAITDADATPTTILRKRPFSSIPISSLVD